MSKAKQIQLPKNLIVPAREDMGRSIESLTGEKANNSIKKEILEGKNISNDLIYATKNIALAKKVALFFNTHGFRVDDDGQLIYQGKRYPVDLEENFMDLVDGLKHPPKGQKTLYKLLEVAGFNQIIRMKYF